MDFVALAVAAVVTGRAPHTTTLVDGMRLSSHVEHVTEHGPTRRVDVDDVIANDTGMTLEARYTFRLPSGGAISRVSLEIDGSMVDGELIDGARAANVYRGIVDAAYPLDPALVERAPDGTLSVKIFPVPAHGERRISIAFDVASDRVPTGAELALGREGFVLRVSSPSPDDAATTTPKPRAIVVDVSHGRTDSALHEEVAAAQRLLDELPDGAQFALLACDSACDSLPSSGTATTSGVTREAATEFLRETKRGGARDVVGAMRAAAAVIGGRGRITYVGSARATAGELLPQSVARGVRSVIDQAAFDGIAIDDPGELSDLVVSCAPSLALPTGLVPVSTRYESGVFTVTGAITGPLIGDLRVNGDNRAMSRARIDTSSVDRLLAQARVDALERRDDDECLDRAAKIARAHGLIARRASFIVLESEKMFAEYGIARTPGAAKAKPPPAKVEPPRTREPMMRISAMVVAGALPAENIRYVMVMNHARFQYCYSEALSDDPSLAGRITLKFRIDRTGQAIEVEDGGSDARDPAMTACVIDVVKTLSFTPAPWGNVVVVYPLLFTREEWPSPRPLLHLRVPLSTEPSPHDLWAMQLRALAHPEDKEVYEELAPALSEAGRTADAARAWDALSDLSPSRSDVHWRAAAEFAQSLDFTRAVAHVTSALQIQRMARKSSAPARR